MSYNRSSISINGREVQITDILSQSEASESDFERATFLFIEKWLKGAESITLYTSGSTGVPKEIKLSRELLIASAMRTIDKLKLSEKNTALVCLDTKYIAGKMMLVRALQANMQIIAIEPSSNPLKNISAQPNFGAFVPLQLDEILKDEGSIGKLNQFNSIIIGGASVSTSLLEKIKTLSCAVYATYGMTETVSHIALQKLNGTDVQDHFETLPGVKITTDDRDCLVIELKGFPETIVTNDIVKIIHSSGFKVLGRYDNIINSGGVKLVPETIEKKLSPLLTHSFFVAGIRDERLGQKLVLIIEGNPQHDLPETLKLALSAYEIPKDIFYLDAFVRTETQKINRQQTVEKALKSKQ